jgi:hypothetical protein
VVRQVEHYRKKLLRKALEDTAAPSPPPPQRKEKSTRHEEPDSDYSSSRSSKKEKRKKKQRDRSSSGKTDNNQWIKEPYGFFLFTLDFTGLNSLGRITGLTKVIYFAVLRIGDVYPGYEFFHHVSEFFPFRIRIKVF